MNYLYRKNAKPDKHPNYVHSTTTTSNMINFNVHKHLKDKENNFNIYFMGANEERVKNLRKNQQISQNMKYRPSNNSTSVATRKRWDTQCHSNISPNIETQSKTRSQSRQNNAKSFGIDYKIVSKMILGNDKTNRNSSANKRQKDTNIDDMMSNINAMNKNILENLNKIGEMESPNTLNYHGQNKTRRRNWGEQKFDVVFPNFKSSNDRDTIGNHKISSGVGKTTGTFVNDNKHDDDIDLNHMNTISFEEEDKISLAKMAEGISDNEQNHSELKRTSVNCNSLKRFKLGQDLTTRMIDKEGHQIMFKGGSISEEHSQINQMVTDNPLLDINDGERCIRSATRVLSTEKERNIRNLKSKNGSKHNNNPHERPFSSIINFAKLKSIHEERSNIDNKGTSNLPGSISNINFIYKSPANRDRMTVRPLSHVQKVNPSVSTTKKNVGYTNQQKVKSNKINEIFTTREMLNVKSHETNGELVNNPIKFVNKTQYPLISNVQMNPKPKTTNNLMTSSITNKKLELINKIDKLDPMKINKLVKMVEELATDDRSDLTLLENKSQNVNINYIKTDSINFGNININVNNQNTLSGKSSLSSFLDKKTLQDQEASEEDKIPAFNLANKSIPSFFNKRSSSPISNFCVVTLSINSTWGNEEKVGLTEVQIFDKNNKRIEIIECHVFNGKEEGISNIHNNKTFTISDSDMWVSYFISPLRIEIYFDSVCEVEKISIWNYNGKDLSKGVKEIEIMKRNSQSWKGIIKKGCFNTKTDYSTRITLNSLSENRTNIDSLFDDSIEMNLTQGKNTNMSLSPSNLKLNDNSISPNEVISPKNYNKISVHRNNKRISLHSANKITSNILLSERNLTNENSYDHNNILRTSIGNNFAYNNLSTSVNLSNCLSFSRIKLILTSNYGDPNHIGLTGLQFIDDKEEIINIDKAISIGAMPKDLKTVYNNDDVSIFENIFNNFNEDTHHSNMWLTLLQPNFTPFIEIVFNTPVKLTSIKVWNYNKPGELEKCARTIDLIIDENYSHVKTIVLRKGIGVDNADYSQTITLPILPSFYTQEQLMPFKHIKYASLLFSQDFDTPYLPTGFIFKLVLVSNWGDEDWIGLNKVELYDQLFQPVFKFNKPKLITIPQTDKEKEEDLYSLINEDAGNDKKFWQGRYLNISKHGIDRGIFSKDFSTSFEMNTIFFIFQKPISLSYLNICNYSEDAGKGVKDIQFFCDDNLVYMGQLRRAEGISLNRSDSNKINSNSNGILFTSEGSIVKQIDDQLLPSRKMKNKYNEASTSGGDTVRIKQ